ncbi:MAG: DUF1294 domain-containing protein [Clostridia bacterium]|nr:DUF1294 domain-containing protein [Clostridia bacterium]
MSVSMLITIVTLLIAVINIAGFVIVAADKNRSKKNLWRIRERTLFLIALLGGCPGIYSALLLFRHKTRHWRFMLGIPAIFIIQVALFLVWYR